jgi:predicted alpha-1,6-mannanase (GH76 family)
MRVSRFVALAVAGLVSVTSAGHVTLHPAVSSASTVSASANRSVCDKYCDGRDPSLSPGQRVPVTTVISARLIRLLFDDSDAMAWVSIDGGGAGDQVWLDRSFDGGQSWSGGSMLGIATVPSGYTGWRSAMFNVDDWPGYGVGAVRACGRTASSTATSCTAWARTTWNAYSPSTASATALMMYYNYSTGLFNTTGWWNSANALTAVIDNIRVSGMPSWSYTIGNTYSRQLGAKGGNFINSYADDTGWWALAWIDAYDLTRDSRYLATARADADFMNTLWDGTCGGGIWWNSSKTYKNAIANSLFLEVNAALHNRIGGDTVYLTRARTEWSWFSGIGLINGVKLVNDGITSTCVNNGQTTWTYNQGVPLAGLAELYTATGDATLMTDARAVADAATTSSTLNTNGILREPCEAAVTCNGDQTSFKGIFVRDLAKLNALVSGNPYNAYLARQRGAAYAGDQTPLSMYGLNWVGPVDATDAARQQSGVDLLNAVPS